MSSLLIYFKIVFVFIIGIEYTGLSLDFCITISSVRTPSEVWSLYQLDFCIIITINSQDSHPPAHELFFSEALAWSNGKHNNIRSIGFTDFPSKIALVRLVHSRANIDNEINKKSPYDDNHFKGRFTLNIILNTYFYIH